MNRTHADPLTIAYIAIGAIAAWEKHQDKWNPNKWEGQLGFISNVIAPALELDRMGDANPINGVFVYEIAETFGYDYAEALLLGNGVGWRKIASCCFESAD
jgi:hypothetical protein